MCINTRQRGVTLIELIVFIVIITVGLMGILSVINVTTRSSADPMLRKQLQTIAEGLMEEVQAQPFTWCDPDDTQAASATSNIVDPTGCTSAALVEGVGREGSETRISTTQPFDNVSDYDSLSGATYGLGDATNTIKNISGNAAAPLGYTASIAVAESGLNGIAASESLLITVTVTRGTESLTLEGYRTRYAPNNVP